MNGDRRKKKKNGTRSNTIEVYFNWLSTNKSTSNLAWKIKNNNNNKNIVEHIELSECWSRKVCDVCYSSAVIFSDIYTSGCVRLYPLNFDAAKRFRTDADY